MTEKKTVAVRSVPLPCFYFGQIRRGQSIKGLDLLASLSKTFSHTKAK